ncbi:hypothetical protein NKR23_g6861 [Pleurostoma richardsiae]|uniref:Uncharacterized protein n=1 Tax=Pleurostoma richardsiae TaxID=41990 RepID=A0AA38RD31_9PEZI|nr:hypothetical protein NKR23_g6861 [Pleurostoma richardsiae]
MITSSLWPLLVLAVPALGSPRPAPTPPPLGDGTSAEPTSACTTWITSLVQGFHGPFTPKIVKTMYTTTDIVYERVPCGGCILLSTAKLAPAWGGIGPVQIFTGTTTMAEPTKLTSTICSAEATPHHGQIPGNALEVEKYGAPPANCTTTLTHTRKPWWLTAKMNGASTVYTTTSTSYESVDCSGCALTFMTTGVPSTWGGRGPVVHNTVTVTATTAHVVTRTVCASSTDTESLITRLVSSTPSASLPRRRDGGDGSWAIPPDGTPYVPDYPDHREKRCTSTLSLPGEYEDGVTTVFVATTWVLKRVDCGSCLHLKTVTDEDHGGGVDPQYAGGEVTIGMKTRTIYACATPTEGG